MLDSDFDDIIQEPLVTKEGYLNPAAMNELEAAISGLPTTHERLSGDSEWNKKHYIHIPQIVGSLAKWACRQSPYYVPDGLENVCKYFSACLKTEKAFNKDGWGHLSFNEISKLCHDILMDAGVKEFDNWNERKNKREGTGYCSVFDQPTADDDFIDLHALLHNICLDFRDEIRKDDDFDRRYKEKYGSLPWEEKIKNYDI